MIDDDEQVFGPQRPLPKFDTDIAKLDEEMSKEPLFMTQMPTSEEAEENVTLQALQSLAFDGTPEEIAENFKEQGNDRYICKQYPDAVKFYTQALEQEFENDKLRETLHSNRAAANLELTLKLNPKNEKALFRAAKALLDLDKCEESINCCLLGLEVNQNNKSFKVTMEKAEKRKKEIDAVEEQRRKRREAELKRLTDIDDALAKRGIKLVEGDMTEAERKKKDLDPEYSPQGTDRLKALWENKAERHVRINNESGNLEWPVLFLYPEFKESDFIEHADEHDSIYDQILTIFEQPAPWDDQLNPRYLPHLLDVYFHYRPKNGSEEDELLIKVNPNMSLSKALSNPKYAVVDGIPKFVILAKSGEFTSTYLQMYRDRRLARSK
ncbi:Tetratricopeptide repeat protein 4 [Zancudomyces culisetae]|uniref:Tetratricopeptide repeat protein 4 n=1 Tax=Zancudomyces culisetae TaxID=1213189 RepID=A0A1R1PUJ3_ZANCU|nr:Tetratricopeptide repeat protein 4 [Zancudomyces culisetae]|eukprot:OMH84562.1 Tetratricopeptide repeat protein 4 [Zancudomyces culisetae]